MGNSDGDTSAKGNKTSSAQEPPPSTSSSQAAVYPEWGGFQAYSPIPPHGFFPAPVASSPQGHPYMWGAQLMPPYGTPPHPYVMYPHAGLYAHPSLPPGSHPFVPYAMCSPNGHAAEASGTAAAGEPDGKSSDGNEKTPLKKSKESLGSLNMITGNKLGKTCGASNGALSQSGDSGSEDSSEGSDANSQNDAQQKPSGEQDSTDAEATQNCSAKSSNGVTRTLSQPMANQPLAIVPMQVAGAPVNGPTTNLNIGMDYWGTPAPSSAVPVRGKVPNAPIMGGLLPSGVGGPRESLSSDLWLQDERELKRQRRKQSNRESARRSRLRKQAECEELAVRVENLKEENSALRTEVNRLMQEHQQLLSQKTSLKEKLDAVSRGMVGTIDKAEQHAGENEKKEQLDVNAPDEAAVADQSST